MADRLGRIYREGAATLIERPARTDRTAWLHPDYAMHDRFQERGGRDGTAALWTRLGAQVEDLRYEVLDTFEQGDRLAARYVLTGRRRDGRAVVAHGMSINHFVDAQVREGWTIYEPTDLDLALAPLDLADPWRGEPLAITPRPPPQARTRLEAYAWLVDAVYRRADLGAFAEACHPDFSTFDPMARRGRSVADVAAFHGRFLAAAGGAAYHIVDAVEQGDDLAVRFRVDLPARAAVAGLSINRFAGERIARSWVYVDYRALADVVRA